MDKSDSRLHYEQIEKLIAAGKFRDAVYLVDKVDWRKTEDNKRLIQAAEVYRKNRRFDDAINILKMAHNRKPNNKKIVFLLCEVYFENKDVVTAQVYLDRYQSMTDKNDWHYDVLKYKRALAYDLPVTEKIDILQDIKAKEPAAEQFRFELASLYQQARQYAECGTEVDELILLFGDDGTYAKKALEIKKSCLPLSDEQESLLRRLTLGEGSNNSGNQNVKLMNTMDMSTLDLENNLARDIQTLKSEDNNQTSKPRKKPEFHTKSLEQTIPPSSQEIFFADKTEDIHFTEEFSLSGYKVKPNGEGDIKEVKPPKKVSYSVAAEDIEDEDSLDKPIPGQITMDDLLSDWTKIKERNTQNMKESIHKGVVEQTGEIFKKKKESKFYGSVTGEIPGSIWKEVELADEFDEDSLAEELADEVEEVEQTTNDVRLNPDTSIIVNLNAEDDITPISSDENEILDDIDSYNTTDLTADIEPKTAVDETSEETMEPEEETNEQLEENTEEETMAEAEEEDDMPPVDSESEYDEEPDNPAENDISEDAESEAQDAGEEIKSKELTPEERKLFAPFLYSRQMREQIAFALDNISMAAYVGNVIITTENNNSGFNLAKSIVKFVKFADPNFAGAMSKVDAEKLNSKDIIEVLDKLNNGALVIENANKLSNSSLIKLTQGINQEERGIIIFLVDTRKDIKRLLTRQHTLSDYFNVRIDIIAMNEDALVDYGVKYANNLGYSLDEGFANLAFHKVVREAQAGNHIVTVAEIKEIIDDAINNNKRGGISKLFRNISGKDRDENGMIMLREKDFL